MGSLYHLEINLYSRDSIVSDRDRVAIMLPELETDLSIAWIILSLEEDVHVVRYVNSLSPIYLLYLGCQIKDGL